MDSRRLPGIYCIRNILNNKLYIGQAKDLFDRERRHRYSLKAGDHDNSHLQRAYNKYGKDAFEFEVLLYCEVEELTKYEQIFVDSYKPSELYNIKLQCVDTTLGVTHTEEMKKHMSELKFGVLKGKQINSKSQFHGVSVNRKYKDKTYWRARIIINGKVVYLGCFDNEISAAKAHDQYVITHGLSNPLNFIGGTAHG
jgi:group I intron endonuclease